jgi:hypothetical protein
MVPPDVADAVRRLDERSAAWSEQDRADWRKVRGFMRMRNRESQRALPAISVAAQEVVQVREHAQRAIDAMTGVFGQPHEESDTAKHDKLPGDPDDQG